MLAVVPTRGRPLTCGPESWITTCHPQAHGLTTSPLRRPGKRHTVLGRSPHEAPPGRRLQSTRMDLAPHPSTTARRLGPHRTRGWVFLGAASLAEGLRPLPPADFSVLPKHVLPKIPTWPADQREPLQLTKDEQALYL